ncbi:MAG: O-antigen ligase family protein, partial [Candidatus Parcubacteria bacterium]|nr:O-antigen ligase family protein [Candidatus Parcubacteria bacterium]
YGTEILLALILVLALIYKVMNRDWEIVFLNYKILDFYILFLLLLIVSAISIFFSSDQYAAWYYLVKMLEGLGLLCLTINFKFSYLNMAGALILSGLVQASLGIYQFLTQQVWASKWLGMAEQLPQTLGVSVVETGGIRFLRAYGSLPHPNILAGFLLISIILLVVSLILVRHQWEKILLWLSLPIILIGLFFTFSKGAFLAFAIAFVFLAIFIGFSRDKQALRKLGGIILISVMTLGILGIIYREPLFTRINGQDRLEVKSQQERVQYLNQAKELLKNNWLTGVGLGNYTLALYNNDLSKFPSYTYQPVHNVYLLVAAELGIFGFIALLLIIIEAMRRIWTYKIDEQISLLNIFKLFKISDVHEFYREKYFWFLGYTSIFIAILVLMAFDHYFWTLYFGIMLWWLCLGMFVKTIGWVR